MRKWKRHALNLERRQEADAKIIRNLRKLLRECHARNAELREKVRA